jgi:hypothetical protein
MVYIRLVDILPAKKRDGAIAMRMMVAKKRGHPLMAAAPIGIKCRNLCIALSHEHQYS